MRNHISSTLNFFHSTFISPPFFVILAINLYISSIFRLLRLLFLLHFANEKERSWNDEGSILNNYTSLTALNFPPRWHFHTAKIDQNKKIEKFSDISATLELTLQLRLFFQWFTGVKLRNFCFYTFPLSFEMAIFKNYDFDLKMLIIFFWRFLIKTSKSLFLVINVIHYLP